MTKDTKPIDVEPVPTQAVAVRENAQELMKRTTDVAGVCREIVLKCACNIQGKKYVKCEGWMAIATAHGCIAGSRDVKKVQGGWTAIGEIRRISDGVLLAQAEGFVGQDEKRWGSANEYACRAMAQTRAISRACRAAFAHVVVLMDAGLSTTPFEEVPAEGFSDAPKAPPASRRAAAPQSTTRPAAARPAAPQSEEWPAGDVSTEAVFDGWKVKSGKSKKSGKPYDLYILAFTDGHDRKFEVTTFDGQPDTLEVLIGQLVEVKHKVSWNGNGRELINIAPADNVQM